MTAALYLDLAWLLPPPADVRARIAAIRGGAAPGADIATLASHALSPNQLDRLGRTIDSLRVGGTPLDPLLPFRLGIVGTGTLDLIAPALVATAARHGFALEIVRADYGQAMQDALDPGSALNRARCDAVLIALDHRDLPIAPTLAARERAATAALAQIDAIRAALLAHGGAPSIVQTIAPPPETLFGSYDRRVATSLSRTIDDINAGLVERLAGSGDQLLDLAALAATVGLAEWHAPNEWHLAKLPFATRCLPIYADHVARLLGAIRGRARRCLVLDLDNTLWGGVIGDDGLAGIRLGQGDATGEAFLAMQRYALQLHERGVVLAVSSKNDDAIARSAFRAHPDMLLREEHIAVFQANWTDKAANIRAIADTLSLGLGSFVLADDNPVERALVRRLLPEVAVPELPADPALYVRTIAAAGYFEATGFSDEDRGRAASYRANADRAALAAGSDGLDAYLASLDMVVGFAAFDAVGRDRIVQLVAKSNQFNLTTRRYDANAIAAFEQDAAVTLQVRLRDMFGDTGMIAVVIVRAAAPDAWEIDSWLMSCRVLGRGVERAVLAELCRQARSAGIDWLVGVYRPTPRNALVRDHYAKLGFDPAGDGPDGETRWRYPTDRLVDVPPMRIER
ncbi:HAD-IIIC family phosphatase [Sphingomonas sp. Leaf4]|uniref:HAD-IIIC family phosphatase n=1 Tax=Sphingomonas sp. Leaf4 TaxID=2876553 RepID=UPI001E44D639|nr:HAD-IIIC family phosphatase [Sphingomonas sp. Leaf4]